jgi:hypothetical protein
MTLTKQNLQDLKDQMQVFAAAFYDVEVTLVEDQGNPITVKGFVGIRSSGSPLRNSIASPITGGSDQDSMTCLFFADDWDLVSPGRAPKKGDVVKALGLRYAIERTILAAPGAVKMIYKSQLKGG